MYVDGSGDQAAANNEFTPIKQKTLTSPIGCSGIGLHNGCNVSITIRPALPDTGIVLRRTDIANGGAHIPLNWRHVVDSRMSTTVGNEYGVTVSTVEHLMAALAGCEVDNAIIDVDGSEVPIMDGSAAPFVFLLECAGTVEQDVPRRAIKIQKSISVGDSNGSLSLAPAQALSITFEIDFESAGIANQRMDFRVDDGAFKSDIARARTFGFAHQVDQLRSAGLALGGSLDNAIVISDGVVLNEGGLRYRDELVRHKILDCVGDLYLAGRTGGRSRPRRAIGSRFEPRTTARIVLGRRCLVLCRDDRRPTAP